MTAVSWMIAAFAVLMASVCVFTYVQIERNTYQARQRQTAVPDEKKSL